jgi:hypothetical protein
MYSTNCLSGFYFKLNYTFSFFFETLYLILHQRKHSLYNVISSIVQRVRLRTIFKYASLLCVLYVQEYYRYSTEYVYNTILVLCAYSLCVQREYRVHTEREESTAECTVVQYVRVHSLCTFVRATYHVQYVHKYSTYRVRYIQYGMDMNNQPTTTPTGITTTYSLSSVISHQLHHQIIIRFGFCPQEVIFQFAHWIHFQR